jgi:twitching motility protein PilI
MIEQELETSEEDISPQMLAFGVLLDYEKRSLEHVAGVPEQLEAPGLWRGIGFRVGDVYLVSGISEVNEILRLPAITSVPGTKAWLLGIANVRGNLMPIVHLRGFLEGERFKHLDTQRVLVVKNGSSFVGMAVDEVLGQRSFVDENKREKSAYLDSPISGHLLHEYVQGPQVWGVFSMQNLVREPDFLQASA